MTCEALHELIERLPEEEIVAAQRFLDTWPEARPSVPPSQRHRTTSQSLTAMRNPSRAPKVTFRPAKWFRTRTFSANSALDEVHVARVCTRGAARGRPGDRGENPSWADSLWGIRRGRYQSPFRGMEWVLRLRVGDFRVIFQAAPDEIAIVRVRHRSDVYR
jgi:hypothetical protein